MSIVRIRPGRLSGSILLPPSKSAAHRAVICGALAGKTDIFAPGELLSDDITATVRAMDEIRRYSGSGPVTVDCGESGSTLRFLIPLTAALGVPAVFVGHGRLPERPIGVYLDCLPDRGVSLRTEGGLPLSVGGQLKSGVFPLPGNVSSQFITGLLLALPLLRGDSEIRLSTPLESAGYIDMTLAVMEAFGVTAQRTESGWYIPGNQVYRPAGYRVERDWSQAAFFLSAGALGGSVRLEGLDPDSCQGDRAAEELFRSFGAKLRWEGSVLTVEPGELRAAEIDAAQIPDLVPALAATASLCEGQSRIYHAERLRIKESDRLAAMADGLNRLGGRVRQTPDGLVIDGRPLLSGGNAEGRNDHRIVMALAVAGLNAKNTVTITDAQSIRKSYPSFFEDFRSLGGTADVIDMG